MLRTTAARVIPTTVRQQSARAAFKATTQTIAALAPRHTTNNANAVAAAFANRGDDAGWGSSAWSVAAALTALGGLALSSHDEVCDELFSLFFRAEPHSHAPSPQGNDSFATSDTTRLLVHGVPVGVRMKWRDFTLMHLDRTYSPKLISLGGIESSSPMHAWHQHGGHVGVSLVPFCPISPYDTPG